jgi:type IV pilus biogenesis protein CpaD/CtpE
MRRVLLPSAGVALALLAGGCVRYPSDYSPHYQSVPLGMSAVSGRERHATVPDACLAYAEEIGPGGERLPAGCANAINLMQMVERERDLFHGRKLGPAPAAPAAHAAERYIDGTDGAVGGAAGTDIGRGPGTSQEEPVARPRPNTNTGVTAKAAR